MKATSVNKKKEEIFKDLVHKKGRMRHKPHKKPSKKEFDKSKIADDIFKIYKKLGGVLDEFPSRFRGWDVEIRNHVIMLDDERHFNRYRLETFESNLYEKIKFPLDDYKNYCKTYEEICLRAATWSEKWSSFAAVEQFGEAGPEGDLNSVGAPKWKQRAYYDFVRDVTQLITDYKVIRVSIWDRIGDGTVDDLLTGRREDLAGNLIDLIKSRM
jgi:hypothetical protein